MQRTFLTTSRSCLNSPSRCASDFTSRTIARSFGNGKRKSKPSSLDPRSREKLVKEAGERALAAKYKRNEYNKQYRNRRREQAEAKKEKEDDNRTYEVAGVYLRANRQPAKDAMKAMKEDWELGPLAPKRDVGERAGKMGTVDMGLHQLPSLTKTQREDVKARMGDNVFVAGDRVVVLKGRDRGKIGTIISVDEEKMSATIDGVGKIAVHVPKFMAQHDSDSRSFRVMRRDIRLDEVKLVAPLRDEITGKVKDVILDRMDLQRVLVKVVGKTADIKPGDILTTNKGEQLERLSNQTYELEDYKWKTLRYIPNTDKLIVDNTKDDDHDYEAEPYSNDTMAITVDTQTYFPSINHTPMAHSILQEVTFRDRKEVTRYHIELEDAIKERAEAKMRKELELQDRVRTPLQQLKGELKKQQAKALQKRRQEFEGPKAAGATVKTPKEDVMVTIGRAMATNWVKNPQAVPRTRKSLIEEVLAQEGAVPTLPKVDARV